MRGIMVRNTSVDCADTDRPVVNVLVRDGVYRPLPAFCSEYGVTPIQFLPIDAARWPGCFVGVFAPDVYDSTNRS